MTSTDTNDRIWVGQIVREAIASEQERFPHHTPHPFDVMGEVYVVAHDAERVDANYDDIAARIDEELNR